MNLRRLDLRGLSGRPARGWLLTAGCAIAGGYIVSLFGIPIAWLIGAMVATSAIALMGLPLADPRALRPPVRAAIGCMLGSGLGGDLGAGLLQWLLPISVLLAVTFVSTSLCWLVLRRVGRLDSGTALFGAMPGGLIEMTMLADSRGGNPAAIAVIHTVRIFAVILSMPVLLVTLLGLEALPAGPARTPVADFDLVNLLWLLGCAVLGIPLGRYLRLPSPDMFGPLILSGIVHVAGWSQFQVPMIIMLIAQVIIGTIIGVRFKGLSSRWFVRLAALSFLTLAVHCSMAIGAALAVANLTGIELVLLLLAYAPAGMSEMSLIAVAIGRDAVFVASHQLARIFSILLVGPPVSARLLGTPGTPGGEGSGDQPD